MRLKWLAYGGNSSTMNAYPYWTSRPTYEPPSAEFLLFPGIWLITVIQQHISWQTALWIYLKLCRCIHCETPSLINFWLNSDEFLPFLNSWHLIGQAVSTHFLINCSMDLFQPWLVHSLWDSPGLDNFLSCIPVIFRSDWLSSFHTFPDKLESGFTPILVGRLINGTQYSPGFWLHSAEFPLFLCLWLVEQFLCILTHWPLGSLN